jgi:hypothetical protein
MFFIGDWEKRDFEIQLPPASAGGFRIGILSAGLAQIIQSQIGLKPGGEKLNLSECAEAPFLFKIGF